MNDEEIVREAMANHDKHYWALVQGLKHKRKGWGELADMIGEGSTVAKAIWDKYVDFDFTKPAGLGAAVSASPQPRCPKCKGEDLELHHLPVCDKLFCRSCGAWNEIAFPGDMSQFFAAAPAQEPRQDLYVISSTGDGAQTIIVPESKLKQSVHDTYCSCGLEWQKCADEVITGTLAKLDDEEEWTREYPGYKRHTWSDHGEDYTVTIMRVTAAQEQPVENSPILQWLTDRVHDERGAIEFGMTEHGNLGLFRSGEETPWATGDDVEEVLCRAAQKYPSGKDYEPNPQKGKP